MGNKNIQVNGQYVVIPITLDIQDWGKYTVIASHKVTPFILWQAHSAAINETTDERDVSKAGSLGIYLGVQGACTINVQVKTENSTDGSGWSTFDSNVFTGAGYLFYNIWVLPFKKIRFQISAAVVATIEVFLRT